MDKPDDMVLLNYETFIYATPISHRKRVQWIAVGWILLLFPPKAAVPQSFPFSTTRLGGDGFSHYATTSTKYHNRPDVHTCSPLSFQIFSNILTRKNSTIPHINTRYTVTWLLLYFLKDYYYTTPSFMNFKEIWYFCVSQTCNSQSTSLQTTEINYIVASQWLKPTVA
jgi:hypothetical protein